MLFLLFIRWPKVHLDKNWLMQAFKMSTFPCGRVFRLFCLVASEAVGGEGGPWDAGY